MLSVIVCCACVLAVVPAVAGGQPIDSTTLAAWPREKSVAAAVLMSVSATVLPAAAGLVLLEGSETDALAGSLIVAALLVGPSAGHFYVGSPGGLAVRLGLGAATIVVASQTDDLSGFVGVMAVGTALVLIDGIYDIARLPRVVRRHSGTPVSAASIVVRPAREGVRVGVRLEF